MAIIEFIKKPPKTRKGLRRVINYITNPQKTYESLIGGYNCDQQNAYYEFLNTKENHNKIDGIQCRHFIQSFSPDEKIMPEMARELADRLVQYADFQGFQIIYAVHIDQEHIHTHFVINSVNSETGKRWHQSNEQLEKLKHFSDQLCLEYGLSYNNGFKGRYKSSGEYRSQKEGRSWKYELFLAINQCVKYSTSKDEFILNMNKLGYQVKWDDQHKYITFTTSEGKKCRNNKLYPPERFTKENLEKQFELNERYQDHQKLNAAINLLLDTVTMLTMHNEQSNITKYPLSHLEGQALKDKIIELKNISQIDWDNSYEL